MELTTIQNNIALFKEKALDLALQQIKDPNALHLEPRELKTLVDVVLNLEDSYKNNTNEGEQARKIHRLLEKYSVSSEEVIEDDYMEAEYA